MVALLNALISIIVFYALKLITYSPFQTRKNRNMYLVALWDYLALSPFLTIKYFYKENTVINTAVLFVIVALNFTMLHIFAEGKIWKKILVIALNEVSFFTGEMILFMLFNDQIKQLENWDYSNPVVFMMFTVDSLIGLTIYYTVINIWKKVVEKKIYSLRSGIVFLIFPISQTLLMYSQNIYLFKGMSEVNFFMIIGIFLSFMADIFLMITILRQEQLEEMHKKIEEINHIRELDKKYYEDIMGKQKELSKIRHDMKEQFIIMRDMVDRKDMEGLAKTIEQLSGGVGRTKEQIYCADPTVNAVMSEYEELCRQKNITLKSNLEIYNILALNPVILCSVLSNLLRNAMEATECLETDRNITITAAVKGGYFHVIVDNSYNPDYKKTGHKGLGLEILKDIATKQNGVLKTDAKDQRFIAEVSLENTDIGY